MNEQPDGFDDLMRQRFGDYQKDPPEGAWNNILAGLDTAPAKSAGVASKKWIALPIAASVLLVLTGGVIGISLYRSSETPLTAQRLDALNLSSRRAVSTTAAPTQQAATVNFPIHPNHAPSLNPPATPIHQPILHDDQQVINSEKPLQNSEEAFTLAKVTREHQEGNVPLQSGRDPDLSGLSSDRENALIHLMNYKSAKELNTNLCNTLTPIDSKSTSRIARKSDYARHPEFFLGLNYTPSYQIQVPENDMIHGVSLDAGMQFSHLIVQSGAGIEFQHTRSNSLLTYLADELVDDTSRTIYHKENVAITTRYTYLNVPLLLGYQWNIKNWALSLKAGGIYSVQIGKSKKGLTPSQENAYNIRVFDRTIDRKTQWLSVVLMPEAEYFLNEHFSLNAAPWCRYSMMGITGNEKISAKNPYALGLNLGMKVHL